MIDTEHLKKCTCHIRHEGYTGTGFFVGRGQILTCRHVVPGMAVGDIINIVSVDGITFQAGVQAMCQESDLAVLLTKEFASEHMMPLYDAEVVRGTEWASHGHPEDPGSQGAGLPLDGAVADQVNDPLDRTHDLTLATAQGVSLNAKYKGFSGAGLVDASGRVIGILRYKGTTYLHGVSIRKAAAFLSGQQIAVNADELGDFSAYLTEAFGSFADGIRQICEGMGHVVSTKLSPQSIAEKLKGSLFYPEEQRTVKEVITKLRRNENGNEQLWTGWLKFLTYVAVVRGSYEEVNKVTITLDAAKLSELLGVEVTPMKVLLKVNLNFFFTEGREFFSITSQYIINRWLTGTLPENSCHIFNSPHADFGLAPMTAERKRKIITSITSPSDSGMIVPGKLDFGVIDLKDLTKQVMMSQSIPEVIQNLETLFQNALS